MTTEPSPRSLTVMQAHVAADCPDRANCWARDLHAEYEKCPEHGKACRGADKHPVAPLTWEFCRSCGGSGWVGSRIDHEHPGCGHRCTLCDPPPGYDRTHAKHQLVDDVVRDLVSEYPGTIQNVNLPTPDSALVRLHRGDSTWLVSIARLEVSS